MTAPTEAVAVSALDGRGMPELIVSGSLLWIFQRFVGLIDFLEVDFGRSIPWVAVRVIFLGEPTESAFDFVIGCALFQSEHLVVIALHGLFLRSSIIEASLR